MNGILFRGASEGHGIYVTSRRELWGEAAVMAAAAAAIFGVGQDTPRMSWAMFFILAARFFLLSRRGDWLFFLLGFLLGGGNDLLSMWKGVYRYTPPTSLPVPIPVWMLFFWGEIFVAFRKVMRFGLFCGPEERPARLVDLPLALDLVLAVIYRMIIYRTASQPWVPDALYASLLILRLLLLPPLPHERKLMLAMLAAGPFYEIVLITAGLYEYQTGVLFGLPLWLIIYWAFIIRALKAVFERVEYALAGKSG